MVESGLQWQSRSVEPEPNIPLTRELLKSIIESLLAHKGLEALQDLIIMHGNILSSGFFPTVRQFELSLLHEAKAS